MPWPWHSSSTSCPRDRRPSSQDAPVGAPALRIILKDNVKKLRPAASLELFLFKTGSPGARLLECDAVALRFGAAIALQRVASGRGSRIFVGWQSHDRSR